MTILMGYSEAEDRMKKETDKPAPRVALDKDFYTNNYEASRKKHKEVADSIKDTGGDSVGYEGRQRRKFAMGGAIKERRGFYD